MAKGKVWIVTGLILIAAALLLTVYNMQTELKAGESAAQVLSQLTAQQVLPKATAAPVSDAAFLPDAEALPETLPLPDYVRFPEMEML